MDDPKRILQRLSAGLCLLAAGCAGINVIEDKALEITPARNFSENVKSIKVRVWKLEKDAQAEYKFDKEVLETVERVLKGKGYGVEIVWDDPFSYGDRNDERFQYRGYIHVLNDERFLSEDTAFLEIANTWEERLEDRVRTHTGDVEVGHLEDETGHRIATEYRPQTTTREYTVHHYKSSANASLFYGDRKAIYDRYASVQADNLLQVTEAVLREIPKRKRE
ncbi:MAG TPA: hypothetical protein P5079_07905 [Elusimicrobiota bacterium]|nr:hypothetical protein [Elusimicrobiota bacterium]